MKKLLPIGSVVLLSGGEKHLMIIGVIQTNPEDGMEYDYLACLYPEGFVGQEHMYLFNHEEINRIDAEGFEDEEHDEFRNMLAEAIDNRETDEKTD